MAIDQDLTEPPAFMRAFAKHTKNLYIALRKEGFSEKQTMTLLAEVISSTFSNVTPPEEK